MLFDDRGKDILEKCEASIKFYTHYGIQFPARASRQGSRTKK